MVPISKILGQAHACTSATTTSRLGQAITRGDVEFAMDFWSWNPKEPEIAMDFSHHWDPLGM